MACEIGTVATKSSSSVTHARPLLRILVLSLAVLLTPLLGAGGDQKPARKFTNPLYRGQDPWIIKRGDYYFYCESVRSAGIAVWKSRKITDRGARRTVWRPSPGAWNSKQIWAPELHYLRGRWYVYYAADAGDNADHRMGVLRGKTDDPQGPYEELGTFYTGDDIAGKSNNRWAIDGTVLELENKLYFIWSGWPSTRSTQYLYIAPMENPWTIGGNRVKICENDTYLWERIGEKPTEGGLNEGPEILKRNGKVFLVYSCSAAWEIAYKLNYLVLDEKSDPLNPKNWKKNPAPVFQSTKEVFGVGHASFVKSPDGTEDWIVYHSKQSREPGWRRAVSAQRFRWTAGGLPDFGKPLPPGTPLPAPAGETEVE